MKILKDAWLQLHKWKPLNYSTGVVQDMSTRKLYVLGNMPGNVERTLKRWCHSLARIQTDFVQEKKSYNRRICPSEPDELAPGQFSSEGITWSNRNEEGPCWPQKDLNTMQEVQNTCKVWMCDLLEKLTGAVSQWDILRRPWRVSVLSTSLESRWEVTTSGPVCFSDRDGLKLFPYLWHIFIFMLQGFCKVWLKCFVFLLLSSIAAINSSQTHLASYLSQ